MAAQRSRPKAKAADKPTATQSAQTRMVISRTLYGQQEPDEVIEGEVQIFATTPAQVTIGAGVTKNLGNYESLKLDVRLTVPTYVEDLDQTADNVAAIVSERLNVEVDQYMNGGDIGPEEALDEGEPQQEHRPDQGDPEPEPEGDLAADVPEGSDEVDEYGNPFEYDEQGNRLDNEYTEDGYLIQHDDQGAPYIINDEGEVEPIEYEEEAGEQAEDLPVEEPDPEPEPPKQPARRSGRAAANPRSSRRGRTGGRS